MLPHKANNFSITELAHPKIIKDIGEMNTWRRLHEDALIDLDLIRDLWYDKNQSGIYCNRIDLGIDSRGLRPPDDPDGSFYSGHKQGHTFDLEPVVGTHSDLYFFIKELMVNGKFLMFNTMEDRMFTPTWTHVGYLNHGDNFLIISP